MKVFHFVKDDKSLLDRFSFKIKRIDAEIKNMKIIYILYIMKKLRKLSVSKERFCNDF